MQSSRLLLQVVFIFSSRVLAKAKDVMGPDHSCVRWSLDNDGRTRVTFLREAQTRALYLSLWSDDMRLVTCDINVDPVVTERYRLLCDRSGAVGPKNAQRFNISTLLAADGPCARPSRAPKFAWRTRTDPAEGTTRKKRAWILPGTLWCGRGSEAVRYEQLGMFENTDRCCREHDHCLDVIPPFRMNYGVFNPNFYTVSHCDCDQRFRQCLLGVNDTISSMVGYSFFNILQVPCFELKQKRRCTEMYWWGMCKVAKEAPYAVFKPSLPYNNSDTISIVTSRENIDKSTSEGLHVTVRPMTSPHRSSPKSQGRCGSRNPPRGDTFHHRRTKGKACKRNSAVAPSQRPAISRLQTTIPSMRMSLLNVTKSRSLTKNKKRVGKIRSKKKNLSVYPTRSQVPLQATNIFTTSSTAKSILPLTQKPTHQRHLPTTITAMTKTTEIHRKVPKHSCCCRSRQPLRNDTFCPRCKSCSEKEATSQMATVTPSTIINALHVNVTTLWTLRHRKQTTEIPKQGTRWIDTTFSTPIARSQKIEASRHKKGKPQTQVDSYLLQDNISQGHMDSTSAPSTQVERSLKQNNSLRNMTDNHLICGSLNHLDECKYKIPPMEKKYDLQNVESKTAYHCDCTSRLAVQFESFKQLSILPTLLKNYVSQYCFNLPKEKKCHTRKSCFGGFAIASDLLHTLKKTEVTDTAQGRNTGNGKRRGFPVRLYKRCLRLEKEVRHMKIH